MQSQLGYALNGGNTLCGYQEYKYQKQLRVYKMPNNSALLKFVFDQIQRILEYLELQYIS